MSEQESPSQIVPVLVAALVCDVAVPDPVTGKKNLIGIFDRIAIRNFPITRPVSLYMKLSDAEGLYNMEVRYVELKTDEVLGTATGTFTLENRLNSFDFFLAFPALSIRREGRYEFQIFTNETFIGSAFIDAQKRV